MKTSFTCADCGGTFDTDRPDEVAHQEAVETFGCRGDAPGMAVVCDDCYRAIMANLPIQPDAILTIGFTQTDLDLDEGAISALELEVAHRIIDEIERQTMQLLLTGSPDPDGRPVVGISPLQSMRIAEKPGKPGTLQVGPIFGAIRTDVN